MKLYPCSTCGRTFRTYQARTGHLMTSHLASPPVWVCKCATPDPDSIDECRTCRRLVAGAAAERPRATLTCALAWESATGNHRCDLPAMHEPPCECHCGAELP